MEALLACQGELLLCCQGATQAALGPDDEAAWGAQWEHARRLGRGGGVAPERVLVALCGAFLAEEPLPWEGMGACALALGLPVEPACQRAQEARIGGAVKGALALLAQGLFEEWRLRTLVTGRGLPLDDGSTVDVPGHEQVLGAMLADEAFGDHEQALARILGPERAEALLGLMGMRPRLRRWGWGHWQAALSCCWDSADVDVSHAPEPIAMVAVRDSLERVLEEQ
jgi:hypothetical protein